MTSHTIAYSDGETALAGCVYRPAGTPRAAVAVFPTIMNPTPAVRAKAKELAAEGYLALLCDFYGRTPADFAEAQGWATALRSDTHSYRGRLHAGLTALTKVAPGQPHAAIGFCMGGQAVLELARDGANLALVASFHGLLDTAGPAEPGMIKARILVCHGDADDLVPREQVTTFWQEMDRAGANLHFHSYSGVKHGFTNPHPPPNADLVAYDSSADRQSWAAMLGLLSETLG